MSNEQAHLIDKGWKLVDVQGNLLWLDPVDGMACSRKCAEWTQLQRDERAKSESKT